ncbi:MAG: hypothetical protein IJY65_02160 [Clostridia bacterium]|nr:hypothetical protein [Clostridia bacterium]
MAKNNSLVAQFENLPWLVKLILALPALDIVWAVFRIIKGVTTNNLLLVIVGILWIAPGVAFGWIIDLVTILLTGHPILA